MEMEFLLNYMFLATLFGAAVKIARTIKRNAYRDSFTIMGGKDSGGGGGGYSPPAPPDPAVTAAAQGKQDRQTAQTNALLLNPGVVSPYGRISYDTNSYQVPGEQDTVARPTQTITLSPEQQKQYDLRTQVMNQLGQTGVNWANAFQQSQPVSFNTQNIPTSIDYSAVTPVGSMADYDQDRQNVQKSMYNQQLSLMQPQMDQQMRVLQDQLVNSGNPIGSEAYNTQMGNYMRNYNHTLQNLADQAVTQGYNVQNQLFNNANVNRQNQLSAAMLPYQTASGLQSDQFQRSQAAQNQNINALAALLQGSQAIQDPQLPSGAGYNQSAMRSPDLMGMTQSNYNNQLNSYNQMYNQQQAQDYASGNALTSGLFSLGSSLAGLFF